MALYHFTVDDDEDDFAPELAVHFVSDDEALADAARALWEIANESRGRRDHSVTIYDEQMNAICTLRMTWPASDAS